MKEAKVSVGEFRALVLFTKQLHMRLERLENGLPPLPAEERLQPTTDGGQAITTREDSINTGSTSWNRASRG